jgi:hypothetical protein
LAGSAQHFGAWVTFNANWGDVVFKMFGGQLGNAHDASLTYNQNFVLNTQADANFEGVDIPNPDVVFPMLQATQDAWTHSAAYEAGYKLAGPDLNQSFAQIWFGDSSPRTQMLASAIYADELAAGKQAGFSPAQVDDLNRLLDGFTLKVVHDLFGD